MLHFFQHGLIYLESFLQLVRLLVSLDHCGVNDSVHGYMIGLHVLKDFASSANIIILDAGLEQAAISHSARNQPRSLHLAKDFESIFELIFLSVRLDDDAISDSTWVHKDGDIAAALPATLLILPLVLRMEASVHLVEQRDGAVEVPESDAHVNHTVEEDFIGSLTELAWTLHHLLEQVEGHLHLRVHHVASLLSV